MVCKQLALSIKLTPLLQAILCGGVFKPLLHRSIK